MEKSIYEKVIRLINLKEETENVNKHNYCENCKKKILHISKKQSPRCKNREQNQKDRDEK